MSKQIRLVALAALMVVARHLSGCASESPSQCICVPDGHNEKGEQELLCTGGDPSDPLAPCILKDDDTE